MWQQIVQYSSGFGPEDKEKIQRLLRFMNCIVKFVAIQTTT